jgi:hypothetical protein
MAYAWIVDANAISVNHERVIALAQHMRANGRSLRQIVVELRDMGVVNRRGRPLSLSYVFSIVRAIPRADRRVLLRHPEPCDKPACVAHIASDDSGPELPFTD